MGIVLAATNRADMLDSALVRPGRFDRRVPVDLPDVKGRREILNVHVRGKPLAKDLDLDIIAKRTIGFSGASLANLMNEEAIVAARNGKEEIGYEEVDYAIDRVTVGMSKTTGPSFPARQKLVAYHEAGHAVMGLLTPDYDMVTKVTIVPRTNGAGGFTLFTPSEERLESGMYSKRYLEGQLAVALGGRVAEEIIYGEDEATLVPPATCSRCAPSRDGWWRSGASRWRPWATRRWRGRRATRAPSPRGRPRSIRRPSSTARCRSWCRAPTTGP